MNKSIVILLALVTIVSCADWDYLQGGADWDSGECQTNNGQQSPIDVTHDSTADVYLGTVSVPEGMVEVEQYDNGHTIQCDWTSGKKLYAQLADAEGGDHKYRALQWHFHAPSEHTIAGQQFDLEMHIVTARDDGTDTGRWLAVLGYMFVEDDTAEDIPLLTTINANIAGRRLATDTEKTSVELDMEEFYRLVPARSEFYHYQGSLTTPTCNEAVQWYVNKNPIRTNSAQLKPMKDLWIQSTFNGLTGQGNNRVLQDLGTRKIARGHYTVSVDDGTEGKPGLLVALIVFIVVSVVLGLTLMVTGCGKKQGDPQVNKESQA